MIRNEAPFVSLGLVGAMSAVIGERTAEKGPPKPTRCPQDPQAPTRRSTRLAGSNGTAAEAPIALPSFDDNGDLILPDTIGEESGGDNSGDGNGDAAPAQPNSSGVGNQENGGDGTQNEGEEEAGSRKDVEGEEREEDGGDEGKQGGSKENESERGREMVNEAGWPTWRKEGFALLWAFKGGREWEEAVVKWTELERAYGLINSVRVRWRFNGKC
jgi:hypothetical protein